LERYNIYIYGS